MSARISKAKRDECVRLRTQQQLSAPMIARMTGLSNATVYKYLERFPWTGERIMGGKRATWTGEERALLQQLWPKADQVEIVAALPRRRWESIAKKANAMGLRRHREETRKNTRFVHPLCAELRKIRERRSQHRPEVQKKCGYHVNQILNWEMGKSVPNLHALDAWANSLGFKLVLVPDIAR